MLDYRFHPLPIIFPNCSINSMRFLEAYQLSIRLVQTVVDEPKLVGFWIHINTGHHPNAFDNALCVATPLPPYEFDAMGVALIEYGIIKK
jgi:hypothetical protein